jgi:hypothetical protein
MNGSRSVTGFFYMLLEIDDEKAEDGTRVVPIIKSFSLFQASQVERIPPKPPTIEAAPWQSDEPRASGAFPRTAGTSLIYRASPEKTRCTFVRFHRMEKSAASR